MCKLNNRNTVCIHGDAQLIYIQIVYVHTVHMNIHISMAIYVQYMPHLQVMAVAVPDHGEP